MVRPRIRSPLVAFYLHNKHNDESLIVCLSRCGDEAALLKCIAGYSSVEVYDWSRQRILRMIYSRHFESRSTNRLGGVAQFGLLRSRSRSRELQ